MKSTVGLVALLFLVAPAAIRAGSAIESAAADKATFKTGIDLVALSVTVTNRAEKHVLGLRADDFVVLCQHHAQQALALIRRWFATMGLALNEQKTAVKHARKESFDFLGHTFTMLHSYKTGTRYPGVMPSKKAVRRVKDNVREC